MDVIYNETATRKFNFELLQAFIFSCTLIKKLVLVGKLLWRFDIIFYTWVMRLFYSLDTPVVINILYEMIKILHEKILNAYICIDSKTTH